MKKNHYIILGKSEDLMKIRKKSGKLIDIWKTKSSCHIIEVNYPFFEEMWRFDENPGKIRKKSGSRITFQKQNNHIIWEKWIIHSLKKSEDLMKIRKIRKKSGNRIHFRKTKSTYHIWIVKHSFCQEICSKLIKSEDLRSVPSKEFFLKKRFLNFWASLTK